MGLRYSECGRFLLPVNDATTDKSAAREEINNLVKEYLAKGGSIEKLSHTDFVCKEAKLNAEEYRQMFKRNLSFGHKRNTKPGPFFNHKLRRDK